MTELEKIAYAQSFILKLANGVNPIDNTPIPDGDVAKNPRLSKCFFYVSDVLEQVCTNSAISLTDPSALGRRRKRAFSLPSERLDEFEYSKRPITLAEMHRRLLYLAADESNMKKLKKSKIVKWLITYGFLESHDVDGKNILHPTEAGSEIGIIFNDGRSPLGDEYNFLTLTLNAQHFIIDSFKSIASFDTKNYREIMNIKNQGKPWTVEDIRSVVDMYKNGSSLSEIALAVQRTEKAVRIKLKHNGIALDK